MEISLEAVGLPPSIKKPYPFVRGTYKDKYDNQHGTWNPGTHRENPWFIGWGKRVDRDRADPLLVYHADGVGELTLTPISVHRPGNYPTRVFFRRRWRTPDGKEFGSNRLCIATLGEFRRIAKGYRYDFSAQDVVYWTEVD